MYAEPAAFKNAGALAEAKTMLRRMPSGFVPGYVVVLLTLWETHFPKDRQVTLTDFEAATYFQRLCGWNDWQYVQMLEMIASNRAIRLDQQMRPWVLSRQAEAASCWRSVYAELA